MGGLILTLSTSFDIFSATTQVVASGLKVGLLKNKTRASSQNQYFAERHALDAAYTARPRQIRVI